LAKESKARNFFLLVIFVLTYYAKRIIKPRTNHNFYENFTQLLHQSSDPHRRWICCEFQVLLYERTPRSQRNIVDGRRENLPTPWQAACDQQAAMKVLLACECQLKKARRNSSVLNTKWQWLHVRAFRADRIA
jgi:hypothetical protein